MLNDNAGATEMPTLLVKAKFHYTDPTRTGPARTRTDFFCGETPLGPCGSGRVRVVEFSYNDASTSGLYLEVFLTSLLVPDVAQSVAPLISTYAVALTDPYRFPC